VRCLTVTQVCSSAIICHVQAGNGIAIYDQIGRRVQCASANGSLVIGDRVPSVREPATLTAVNVNTAAPAYRELQQHGILNSICGMSLTVSADLPAICAATPLDMIRDRLRFVLREALSHQISVDEIRTLVDNEWEQLAHRANATEHGE